MATSLEAHFLKPQSCRAANFSAEIWIHIFRKIIHNALEIINCVMFCSKNMIY